MASCAHVPASAAKLGNGFPVVIPRMAPTSDAPRKFAVSVGFVGNVAMLALWGEFDVLSVAEIDAVLDAMIADGYPLVVVDLAGLADVDYMATSGMAVIADAAKRLAALDRRLTVRSPSAKALRLLDTTRSPDWDPQAGMAMSPSMSARSPTLP